MKKLLFIQLLIVTLSPILISQNKSAQIDSLLNKYYAQGELNGAVLVSQTGNTIYKNAFGIANSNWDIKNSIDSKFNLYSITKQFTAILAMQFVEDGKLDLNKTISDYLEYYRSDNGMKVTIHHLLTHSHGIPNVDYKKLPSPITLSTEDFITKYTSGDLEFEPGSKIKYSSVTGYTILAAIIEKITNKRYEQVLTEKILKPLKMTNSGFIHYNKSTSKMTTSYLNDVNAKRLHFFMFDCNGSSSIYTTVEDLFLYSKGFEENKLLSSDTKAILFTPNTPKEQPYLSYGGYIADFTLNGKDIKMVALTGGGSNLIAMSLKDDFFIALLNNIKCPKTDEILSKILEILYQ